MLSQKKNEENKNDRSKLSFIHQELGTSAVHVSSKPTFFSEKTPKTLCGLHQAHQLRNKSIRESRGLVSVSEQLNSC